MSGITPQRIPTNNASTPQSAPLTEYPARASTDSEPGPVNATVNPATPRTGVYSYPPRDEEALLDVHAQGGNKHYAEDDSRRDWRKKPQRQKKSAAGLRQPRHQGVAPAWREPEHREELTGGVNPRPAEPAKQFSVRRSAAEGV